MMPSASEAGAVFMLADVDIAHDFVYGFRVYHRAYFDFWIGAVADAQSFGSRYQFLREFTIDFLVHDQARRGGATLARGAKRSPDRAFDRVVDVRVIKNNDRVLAAHLQRADRVAFSARQGH